MYDFVPDPESQQKSFPPSYSSLFLIPYTTTITMDGTQVSKSIEGEGNINNLFLPNTSGWLQYKEEET